MDDNRKAVMQAAAAFDEVKEKNAVLQRSLDETAANLKAQETLVHKLELMLNEERNLSATYRADAEQSRADVIEVMERLKTIKMSVDSFQLPDRRKLLEPTPRKDDQQLTNLVNKIAKINRQDNRETAAAIPDNRGEPAAH